MRLITKLSVLAVLVMSTVALVTGCGSEPTPYEQNDADNYTVSVKYDANGGVFTTNTSVIMDTYSLSELPTENGKAKIALLSPDDSRRGNDAFTPVKNGYFLAGWYTECTETLDEAGNPVYVYNNKWDFENGILEVDSNKTYTSAEPVVTLYAAWVPLFQIQFCDLATGESVGSITFDPTLGTEFEIPQWDKETGAIQMYKFPEKDGYTFNGVYHDAEGTKAVEGTTLVHTGAVDYNNGMAKDAVMTVYVDWIEGQWFHIYTAEQFIENASIKGCYEIHGDLDFTDKIWPTSLMYGNFSGTIHGNGHEFKNIKVTQTNNSKTNAGLFGSITEEATITDLTLSNVTFTIEKGTRKAGTCYGTLAGTVSENATISNLSILDSVLQVDSSSYFGVDDYSIGLVSGMGTHTGILTADIEAKVTGDAPETLKLLVEEGKITLEFITQ